ncbi:MAG: GlsB/YeaQ/YmgE family stress response membrane protein [Leptonema sp. (in: bacteria)]
MGVLSWILFGLIVGIIAKFLMPGKDPGGLIITILLGIGGAFLGGFIGTQLGFGSFTGWNLRSFLLAVGGALLILVIYRFIKSK